MNHFQELIQIYRDANKMFNKIKEIYIDLLNISYLNNEIKKENYKKFVNLFNKSNEILSKTDQQSDNPEYFIINFGSLQRNLAFIAEMCQNAFYEIYFINNSLDMEDIMKCFVYFFSLFDIPIDLSFMDNIKTKLNLTNHITIRNK